MKINGSITFPGDKSISHRAIIFASLCNGKSIIKNLSDGKDVQSTIKCLQQCGIKIEQHKNIGTIVYGSELKDPKEKLNCGNSGTTTRLLIGLLAGKGINATFIGDKSLSKRPMNRVLIPLKKMGLNYNSNNGKLPVKIYKSILSNESHVLEISSAQIKSAILLASLNSKGVTLISEPNKSRDHTEILLKYFGSNISLKNRKITFEKVYERFKPFNIKIPGDPSSASFFGAAAAILPNSKLHLKSILLNPTRIGFFEILSTMGAKVSIKKKSTILGEVIGDITIQYFQLRPINISKSEIPTVIDEIPILALIATQAKGRTVVSGANELRYKECDRIHAICTNLKNMGANITEKDDGFIIIGPTKLKATSIKTYDDHRIAMSFTIANLLLDKQNKLDNLDCVSISYPNFYKILNSISS